MKSPCTMHRTLLSAYDYRVWCCFGQRVSFDIFADGSASRQFEAVDVHFEVQVMTFSGGAA